MGAMHTFKTTGNSPRQHVPASMFLNDINLCLLTEVKSDFNKDVDV